MVDQNFIQYNCREENTGHLLSNLFKFAREIIMI